ncbi:hypothetical protein AB0D68_33175 [Streptomyces sp. NPDC048212]
MACSLLAVEGDVGELVAAKVPEVPSQPGINLLDVVGWDALHFVLLDTYK